MDKLANYLRKHELLDNYIELNKRVAEVVTTPGNGLSRTWFHALLDFGTHVYELHCKDMVSHSVTYDVMDQKLKTFESDFQKHLDHQKSKPGAKPRYAKHISSNTDNMKAVQHALKQTESVPKY